MRRATAWCVLGTFLGTLPGAPPAFAAPEGERVVHGEATFDRNGNDTTITTRTRETIVDYDRFDIGVEEKVRIDQPDSRSKILNRVPYGDASRIDGGLSSNGIVYILNPSGVFLGDRAIVDVGGLVAGAGNLSNQDFLAGIDRFTEVDGEIGVAEGATVRSAGDVALVGRRVANLGSILAEAGMIAIVAGGNVVLAPLDGHVAIHVDGPSDPQAEEAGYALTQAGTLEAQRVTLSAGDTYSLAMNHTGVTRAQEIHVEAGGDGLVQVAGELDASNAQGAGGKIRVLGGKVALMDAQLDASGATGGGEILVGGDVRGGGGLPTARRLYVGPDAQLRADATQNGDGGKIVMYSRERTAFLGSLSARGGAEGGDGGFAEISGAQLESSGLIALGAPAGKAGTLLYDPDEIQIEGGAADGTDSPDASDVVLSANKLGEVLSGDTGTGAEPFVIYESEIEGTDANIILEAVNRIFASGNFSNIARSEGVGVVALAPERNLTLRTTGTTPGELTSADLGIDLTTSAHGEALEWRVTEGGRITLATSLATIATPPADAPKASIKAGALVAAGLNYPALPPEAEPGTLQTPDVTEILQGLDAISVTTARGDIDVARISADGDAAQAGRLASPGRNVNVTTAQGDVVVDRISSVGGSAAAAQATRGEFGGEVVVSAGGNATIGAGGIDVSGGNGRAGAQIGDVLLLDGGDGGVIQVTTNGADTLLLVQGDLTARGGTGQGSFDPEEPEDEDPVALLVEADGGIGGAVQLSADSDLTVEAVTIDTSGGDGTGSGGGDVALLEQIDNSIRIIGGRGDTPNAGDVRVDALLRANGGNAHTAFAGENAPLVGGAGGRGGNIVVQANGGELLAGAMQIEANGGVGHVGVGLDGVPLVDEGSRLVGTGGGTTGTMFVSARDEVVVGDITARGGDGINAAAGRGGVLTVQSTQSSVTLAGDIDLGGGDASLPDATPATEVAVDGGLGGSLTVSTLKAPATAEDEAANVGDIFLAGVVGGQGGSGVDADGAATRSAGVSTRVTALGDLELGAGAPAAARFTGGNLDLEARNIGSVAPIGIAGTVGSNDFAQLTASGIVQATVDPQLAAGSQTTLERVDVQITDVAGRAELFRGGETILESVAAAGTTPHTLAQLGRDADVDPTLGYRLNATVTGTTPQPVLLVAENGVRLGTAGGEIANGGFGTDADPIAENRGAIEGAGPGVLGTTRGTLRLEGSTLGVATDTTRTPLRFAGDEGAALRLDAEGDVHVDVEDGGAFGAIDVVQRGALADVTMQLQAADHVTVVSRDDDAAANVLKPIHTLEAHTTASGSAFAYKVDAGTTNVQVDVDDVRLGGTGLLSTTGDLVLTDAGGASPAIATNGHDLSLISRRAAIRQESASAVAIDFTGDDNPDDETPARLALRADSPIGSATAPLRTRGLQGVAGTSFNGGFYLVNADAGPGAQDLRIERVTNLDPPDLDGTESGAVTEVGVIARNGDLEITHEDPEGRIVLGALRDVNEFVDLHAGASGDVVLNGDIEIENARFRATQVLVLDDEGEPVEDEDGELVFETVYLRLNDAHLRSTSGDVVLNGSVDTSAASTLPELDPNGESGAEFVHASLLTEAGGTVRFAGDVGKRADDQAPLALLDTTNAAVDGVGVRSFEVGDAHFRGTLDGPAAAAIEARDLEGPDDDHEATVQFDGDVGQAQQLTGLEVDAERIAFTSADKVVTGAGGIDLDTHQTAVPQIATITDSNGGIRFSTMGTFRTGELDKLSSAGALQIAAATALFTDLSATQLTVNSPNIVIRRRAAGPVEQRGDMPAVEDGPIVATGFDEGTDIVADRIDLSSVPTVDETTPGATPRFGLGSGGIRAPGSLSGFEVVRFTAGVDSVEGERFFGTDGRILDLTPTGNPVIGNPSSELPRERAVTVPSLPPQFSDQKPAAPPAVDSEQVLAFLRCGAPGGLTTCDAQAAAPLATLTEFGASTLATERAADLAERYRALRSRDLSNAFDAAGAGFRETSDFGEFDPQAFGSYLEASREHEPARTAIHELATLLVEIDLLGLTPEVEAELRHGLASDLAHEANLPGFDADAVLVAVAATPIGIPAR